MRRFKKILVYINTDNETSRALQRAVTLAAHNNAALKVVDVAEELPGYVRLLGIPDKSILSFVVNEKREHLDTLVREMASDMPVSTEVLIGAPFLAVIRDILKHGHDLVIKDIDDEEGPDATDMHLLRKCPCPLWLEHPMSDERIERVAVAVDPVPDDTQNLALSSTLMEIAVGLKQSEHCMLHVIHAWLILYESILRQNIAQDQWEQFMEESERTARDQLKSFLKPFTQSIQDDGIHLLKGDPGQVIPAFVRKRSMDLLVMGTVARTGIQGFLIGNTAEIILKRIGCSIIAVKPSGFRTPVKLESD